MKQLFYLYFFAFLFLVPGCLIDSRNFREDDTQTRTCVNDDGCSFSEFCDTGICAVAPGCLSCTTLPHAQPVCFHGLCMVQTCQDGYFNANGLYLDGCELSCTPTQGGVEVCDGIDNDCDGVADEDFNLGNDPLHCGSCDISCDVPPNGAPLCSQGNCYFICLEGFYDIDGDAQNGCESTVCEPTHGGVEICDLRDNNCDGQVDEGIDKTTTQSCGPLCETCSFDHAQSLCLEGVCTMGLCDSQCQDLNGLASDGCEYCCTPTAGGVEICDGLDNDCNGLVDEGLTCICPPEMVNVESTYCMDIYEASRPDATLWSQGTDSSTPLSRPDVMPWLNVSLQDAVDACSRAGKRLCTATEWEVACKGPTNTVYSYGDDYDTQICNGIDTFCRCEEGTSCEGVDPCPYAHCYNTCGADFGPQPTGSFPSCEGAYGAIDITGNAWERVQGGTARGGAYNCLDSESLHKCSYIADWGTSARSNFGFRCCCSGSDCPQ
ncbi:formylglycine-generating enzyme family protein [Myxococcota bacterium]|nr:formylglycine-generating enzyme family protein [Myxococcota bacterium]MBU1536735.1 formylglycine-generating enzyme family protein [Myxococcota bacterium]